MRLETRGRVCQTRLSFDAQLPGQWARRASSSAKKDEELVQARPILIKRSENDLKHLEADPCNDPAGARARHADRFAHNADPRAVARTAATPRDAHECYAAGQGSSYYYG